MKIVIQNYFFSLVILFIFYTNNNVFGKELIIKNDDDIFNYFYESIQNISDNEIIIKLVDNYYDMSLLSVFIIDMSVYSNISFIGNANGTVFDYNEDKKGSFKVFITKNFSLKFENIIFENFNTKGYNDLYNILLDTSSDKFNVEFNNCTFRNNKEQLIGIASTYTNKVDSQIIFHQCNFL